MLRSQTMNTKFIPNDHWNSEIARFLKGELTFSEEQLLQQWANENEEQAHFYEEMRNTWLTAVTFASESNPLDNEWSQMNERLNTIDLKTPKKNIHSLMFSSFRRIASIAAMFLLAMIIGAILSRLILPVRAQNGDEMCEMITPLGAKSQVVLPDGTRVWLNAGSRLTYKKSFNTNDRLVTLQGEAFFHVKSNKNKPFIVQTSKLNVKALGTSFNVKAYPEDKSVTATLVEGIIQVEGKGANSKPFTVTLKPKETITYMEKSFEVAKSSVEPQSLKPVKKAPEKVTQIADDVLINKNVNTLKFTSWKDPQWQVEAENLENLSVLLGRRFNVIIHKQSSNLKEYRFTGTIRNETLEQVLEILGLTTPLKYKIGKGEVWWDIDPLLQENYSKILAEKNLQK